jgi:hypothetical protein
MTCQPDQIIEVDTSLRIKEGMIIIIIGSTLKKGNIYPKFQCWKAPGHCSGPAQ